MIPDAEHVTTDTEGNEMYRFAVNYEAEDGTFTTYIWAYSWTDAEKRAEAMKRTLVVAGQIYSVIPAQVH